MVERILDCSEDEARAWSHLWQIVESTEGLPREPKVGWLWEKGAYRPDIKPVTPRQIRQAWILSGRLLSEIIDMIDLLPEPSRSLAHAEWEYSTLVFRTNPLVSQLAAMQGFTDQELDDLWIFAGSL